MLMPLLRSLPRSIWIPPQRSSSWTTSAGTLAGSRELREVLMNPSIATEQKLKVLDAIAGRIGMFPQVRNFIAVIMDHRRLAELNEILAEYHACRR